MERFRIVVSGRVQRVGYRDNVVEIARKLGIVGTVKNMEDEVSVEVIAEGEKKQLDEFAKFIKFKDYAVEVEKLEIHKEKATGEFKYFKILRGDGFAEIGERLDTAGKLLYLSLEKHDQTLAVSKSMDSKLDGLGSKLDSFSTATTSRFDVVDKKYGKISERLEETNKYLKELVEVLKAFKPK